jgi:hypothetical protein
VAQTDSDPELPHATRSGRSFDDARVFGGAPAGAPRAAQGLWRTDGIAAGTYELKSGIGIVQ